MYLQHYTLHQDYVHLIMTDESECTVGFNQQTGLIHYAFKNGIQPAIKHPGIYLGQDAANINYYLHNHRQSGRPALVTEQEFSQGQPLFIYEGIATNPPLETVRIGLEQLLAGTPYNLFGYNCQTFVNIARQNKRRSEAIEKAAGALAFGALVFVGLKAFFSTK